MEQLDVRARPKALAGCSEQATRIPGPKRSLECEATRKFTRTSGTRVTAPPWPPSPGHVSTVTNSSGASVNKQTCLTGALSALDALPTIKVPWRHCTPRAASRITLSRGPQTALKTFLSGTMDGLWLVSHGDMGRERCEGHYGTGPCGAVLADDSPAHYPRHH
ncbi:hypothetical protein MTO96_012763 [Rhipicephalus appendiculatus]